MTAQLTSLEPNRVAELIHQGRAILVDIREADEFARRHVPGAISRPLSAFESAHLRLDSGQGVIFTCRSGMRTQANCARLAAAVNGSAFVLAGGVDGWAKAGLPVAENRDGPIELMRQVQIAAGLMVLVGVGLGFVVHPGFFGLSAMIGAGLTFAGVTGHCGLARILLLAPWNRAALR